MNQSAMNRVVEGIPQGGKLSALIEHQKVALGSEELKKKLVEVCSTIPNPIIGAVEDELRSESVIYRSSCIHSIVVCTEFK